MIIDYDKQLVFIANPKNATTSIEEALCKYYYKNYCIDNNVFTREQSFSNLLNEKMWVLRAGKMFSDNPKIPIEVIYQSQTPVTKLHKHSTFSEIREERNLENFTFITTVRNPWEIILSWYLYYQKQLQTSQLDRYLYNFAGIDWIVGDFSNFINTCPDFIFQSQMAYTIDEDKSVDHIIRYENLNEEWKDLTIRYFETEIKLPRKNTTKHGSYKDYYTDDLIEIVRERCKEDIDHFNYAFE